MDYIFDKIEPNLIRQLAKLSDDDALKTSFYVLICELMQGNKYIPLKKAKGKMARALKAKGASQQKIKELTGISKTTYYEIKGEDE